MKKRWIVMAALMLAVVGYFATSPAWKYVGSESKIEIDAATRAQVIDTLVAKLNRYYVFPDKARQIEHVLRQHQREGRYDGIRSGPRLARQLTADLHGVARDLHMVVRFAPGLDLEGGPDAAPPASQAEWEQRHNIVKRLIMRHTASREVKHVSRLSHNIGYMKVSSFPDAVLMRARYAEAMDELADTNGLIVDLRHNRGGDPQSVALLISYFVDGRTRLNDIWDRETGKTTRYWTDDKLEGKRYGGGKPVMILVDARTGSAGEDFAYTMQALRRATVIGARTWGGAHPSRHHRIGEHFFVHLPGKRTINPITGTNWEGVGVTPDIAAAPEEALAVARNVLRRRLTGGATLAAAEP